ncbi:MAG: hypothetical protein RSE18_00030 [Acinetobacter sp.]
MTTNYKGYKIIALDGTLRGRLHIQGPKLNEVIHGGGLKFAVRWIDAVKS